MVLEKNLKEFYHVFLIHVCKNFNLIILFPYPGHGVNIVEYTYVHVHVQYIKMIVYQFDRMHPMVLEQTICKEFSHTFLILNMTPI